MPTRKDPQAQLLAIASLIVFAAYFYVSQPSFSSDDPKLAALLSWSYYGSIIPRLLLWYISTSIAVGFCVGLLAIALGRGWGAILMLVTIIAGLLLVPFEGVIIQSTLARAFGMVLTVFVLTILARHFLRKDRPQVMTSNNRFE